MHWTTPELERAMAHLAAGNRKLPLELVKELQEQGFDPESLVQHYKKAHA